jgi:hypothetical protein
MGRERPVTRLSAGLDDLCFIALANFAWEMLYLPLYTIWTTGTLGEQAFAVAHCPAEKS